MKYLICIIDPVYEYFPEQLFVQHLYVIYTLLSIRMHTKHVQELLFCFSDINTFLINTG
jgi:hypothetical protein